MTGLNWKQDGILADLSCDVLDNHLIALGLMYFRLTQPYWQLLGQDVRYLEFYAYVVMMKQFLERSVGGVVFLLWFCCTISFFILRSFIKGLFES